MCAKSLNSENKNNVVAIVISIFAILISGFHLWLDHLYKYNDLIVNIPRYTIGVTNNEDCEYSVDCIFSNFGNRPCAVIDVVVETTFLDGPKITKAFKFTAPNLNQYSFTIEPGEITSKHFKIGVKPSSETIDERINKNGRLQYSLVFYVMDNKGGIYFKKIKLGTRLKSNKAICELKSGSKIKLLPNKNIAIDYFHHPHSIKSEK